MQDRKKSKAAPKKRGPGGFRPTTDQRKDVMLYKAGGISEPAIAIVLGISQNTLRKYFAGELECGRDVKRAQNIKRIEDAAENQNVAAMKALNTLFDKGETVDLLADPDYDTGRQAQREAVKQRVTKKQVQRDEAFAAGTNSEWGEDLAPIAGTKPN